MLALVALVFLQVLQEALLLEAVAVVVAEILLGLVVQVAVVLEEILQEPRELLTQAAAVAEFETMLVRLLVREQAVAQV
jgi:hypothetical protein